MPNLTTKQLESLIKEHNDLYWKDNAPEISDQEYDLLVEELRAKAPNSKILTEIPTESRIGSPVKHDTPMLSMDKAYSLEEVFKWAKGTGDTFFVATPKMDGSAVSIVYEDGKLIQASTRGNGDVGEDVTENIKHVSGVPHTIEVKERVEVRGEVVMPLSVFNAKFANSNSNPRNLAAGSLKLKNSNDVADRQLKFYAYSMLGTEFLHESKKLMVCAHYSNTVKTYIVKLEQSRIEEAYNYFVNSRDEYDFEIDGVIFTTDSINIQKRLGFTSHHPKYSIAWKIAGEMATTTLKDIEWSISRTGIVTPVAIVEPVKLSGAMVSRCTLHHAGFVKSLDLTINAAVEMSRRGMVIPQIERVVKAGDEPFEIPTEVDGHEVYMDGDFLKLKAPNDSLAVLAGRIKHFFTVLDIDGFGDKVIQKLCESGDIKGISDIYYLTFEKFMKIDRMGEKSANNLLKNLRDKSSIPLHTFLRSLGIDDLGKSVSKVLANEFKDIFKILKLIPENLSSIDGIGDIIANNVVNGLKENESLIFGLLKHIKITEEEKKTGIFSNQSFLFTGALEHMPRKEAQEKVESLGGTCPSSVTKDLTYLVVGGNDTNSSKSQKATKLNNAGANIKIISEGDFVKMLK